MQEIIDSTCNQEQMQKVCNKFLVFGASGAIGTAIIAAAEEREWDVVAAARSPKATSDGARWIKVDPLARDFTPELLKANGPYSAVCWAQGTNANDSVYDVSLAKNRDLYESNCLYILATLKALLNHNLLEHPARLCVVSSIWQNLAKQNKLSYCMTKAALQGLVLSASADLAVDGHLINAVLPGALDTPMTRVNLDDAQISSLTSATLFKRLPSLGDVASLVLFLCSPENSGITGQFIAADLGFSNVRLL